MNMRKKGQVTIFIIVAVVIVALGVLTYMFYPQIKTTLGFGEKNPPAFIQSCLEEKIRDSVEIISSQGGSMEPEFYFNYLGDKIEYLCYVKSYYKTCVVQQPMLKKHIEEEISAEIQEEADACFDAMKENFEKKDYSVDLKKGEMYIELLPEKIVVGFNHKLSLTKDATEKYDSFKVVLNNNLYERVAIADSIINWEASYGDSEVTMYMDYYHDLKVEKKKQSDGTTIYILTDRDSRDKFQFASRSVAWPPGYGAEGVY